MICFLSVFSAGQSLSFSPLAWCRSAWVRFYFSGFSPVEGFLTVGTADILCWNPFRPFLRPLCSPWTEVAQTSPSFRCWPTWLPTSAGEVPDFRSGHSTCPPHRSPAQLLISRGPLLSAHWGRFWGPGAACTPCLQLLHAGVSYAVPGGLSVSTVDEVGTQKQCHGHVFLLCL